MNAPDTLVGNQDSTIHQYRITSTRAVEEIRGILELISAQVNHSASTPNGVPKGMTTGTAHGSTVNMGDASTGATVSGIEHTQTH